MPCSSDSSFPVIQYEDDTLIIMECCVTQLEILKEILNIFTLATGLKVNFNKSLMVPINLEEEKLDLLAASFNCAKGSLPFTYLGLPLGITKPKVEDFLPLVSKCERRLQAASLFLSQAGRLQMTNRNDCWATPRRRVLSWVGCGRLPSEWWCVHFFQH